MPAILFFLAMAGMLAGAVWAWRAGARRRAAGLMIGAMPVAFGAMMAGFLVASPADGDINAESCRADADCFRRTHALDAAIACQGAVADRARFSLEWMDGDSAALASFPVVAVADLATGGLLLTGDRVRFQNGFGAMERMRYACEWSEAGGVVAVTVEPLG